MFSTSSRRPLIAMFATISTVLWPHLIVALQYPLSTAEMTEIESLRLAHDDIVQLYSASLVGREADVWHEDNSNRIEFFVHHYRCLSSTFPPLSSFLYFSEILWILPPSSWVWSGNTLPQRKQRIRRLSWSARRALERQHFWLAVHSWSVVNLKPVMISCYADWPSDYRLF